MKIIFLSIWAIAITLFMISCRPAEKPEEISTIIVNDTAVAVIDLKNAKPVIETAVEAKIKVKHKPLKLIIEHLASPSAPVIVGIYRSKHKFLSKESRLKEYTFIPKGNTLTVYIADIDYSEIAVAIYQDMNSNGKFDKNFIGLPKEGYAFSNNFKPTIKAPDYDDCKFNYDSTSCIISMHLIK